MTLAAPKLPLVLPPSEARAGDIVIADIGIPTECSKRSTAPACIWRPVVDAHATSPRTADTHKGDYGRVLVVAGSRGKTARPISRRSARCARAPAW